MDCLQRLARGWRRALDLAQTIGDPTQRFIAISHVLPYYARLKSSQSEDWLTRLLKRAESLSAGEPKLRLLVQLAQDQIVLHKEKEGLSTASHAVDLAEELFSVGLGANRGKMAYTMPRFDPLIDLASGMATAQPGIRLAALARIRQVKNELLQAHAEVAFAKELAQVSSSA